MSKNEKTRKYIIYFRFTVLLLALAIPVIFNIYNYYSGTDYWIITLDLAPFFIGFTIWLLVPYIILIGISFFWKKIAQLIGAGALMLTVEFLVNLSLDRNSMDVLVFLVLPILQAIIILPIGMGLGFIASFLIKNYQTGKSMTTYQKNVLGFALIILLPLCFFIYLQKSDMDYTKAIEIKSKERRTELRNSYYTEIRGKMKLYTKAIELNPNDTDAYYKRGSAKSMLQDYTGAIQDYNKAIELNPNYADAYYNRGFAKFKLQDYKGVIQDFNKAIELNPPNYAKVYYNRGLAKIHLGQKDKGCLDLSKADEMGYDLRMGHSEAYDSIKQYCN